VKTHPINNNNINYNNPNIQNNIINKNITNQINSKYEAIKEHEKNINNLNKNNINLNLHNRKNSKEENFPNYPIRENDEFSINTSNFTNRWDLGNFGDKMDMSNLHNNNFALKNHNIMINYTKDNPEEFTAENNTIENPPDIMSNRGNEAYFSSSIKNQMSNLTNKINNIGNKNNMNPAANHIEPIIENESLNDDLTNNKLEEDLRNRYLKSNYNINNNNNNNINFQNNSNLINDQLGNLNNVNYKEFYNKEKIHSQNPIDNLNNNFEDFNLNSNLLANNNNRFSQKANSINDNQNYLKNNKQQKIKEDFNSKENSDEESDNESSGFKNQTDNDMNITQNQLNDLKKEIYKINKQTKKQNNEADKNKISSNKIKTLKNLADTQNITANANNTNFTEKTKITNLSTAKENLNYNNNNNDGSNNQSQKIKRRPSPYLRKKEPISTDKAPLISNLRKSKSNNAKIIIANSNDNNNLTSKPFSIQSFQQNTNIMHIDPMVNPIPQMIYNMNTFNNNYANGYGNINLAYNPTLPAHGINLPYSTLLPQMNYLNNVNIPNQIYGGFPAQNPAAMGNFYNNINNNIQNLNSNPNNNVTNNDNTSIQDSYLKKSKGENTTGYKAYTIKDYKEKINDIKKLEKLPRSLGANIGTKEWEEKAEKNKKTKEYAKNIAGGTGNKKLNNPILENNDNNNFNINENSYSKINNKTNTKNSKSTPNNKNSEIEEKEGNKIKYAIEEKKPMHVKDFYTNLKGIQEASDNEDSFEEFENKLERELDNPKNRNSIKKANTKAKKKTEPDSLDDIEIDSDNENYVKTKKIQSGKSHIHNLINLKKTSSDKNTNVITNVNENAVITVNFKNKDAYKKENRPKSTTKLENIKKNYNANIDNNINNQGLKGRDLNIINIGNVNKKNSNSSADHNKIYTTLGTDRDIVKRLKPLNTSRINSTFNTSIVSRPFSSKNVQNKNNAKIINVVNANSNITNVRKGEKDNIDELLQKHDLYYEKAQKIKNFMLKL
jgi:hypothetical protein